MANIRAKYRARLPQLSDQLFLTDGGLETTLIFHDGIELPHFASFDLLKNAEGTERIRRYYARYAKLARDAGLGFVLESRPGAPIPTGRRSLAIRARRSPTSTASPSI